MTEQVRDIAIEDLVLSEFNPRKDPGDIAELAASIRERGVLEPILVTPVAGNGHFAIVAGSRRFAAAKKAGQQTIPAIVREMSDADAEAVALVENLQREDLSPLEEAAGYARWLEIQGKAGKKVTHDDLAKAVGKARPTVTNTLRILKAPAAIKDAVKGGLIQSAHVRELLKLEDESLFAKVRLVKGITVKDLIGQVEDLNHDWQNSGAPAIERARKFLAEAQAAHPKATFIWASEPVNERRRIVDLVDALGKPPAKKVGEAFLARAHDKVCACRAYEITTTIRYSNTWDEDGNDTFTLAGFEMERVCIDAAGWDKYLASSRTRSSSSGTVDRPKPKKTAAQIAKDRKQRAEDLRRSIHAELHGASSNGYYADRAPSPDLLKKFTAGGWTGDKAARLLLLSYATEHIYTSSHMPEIVRAVLAMKPKDVRELVLKRAAAKVHSNVTSTYRDNGAFDRRVAKYELLTAYGVKTPEPKRKAPKAKKKARR